MGHRLTVFHFEAHDTLSDRWTRSEYRATETFIVSEGARMLPDTGIDVDADDVQENGIYRPALTFSPHDEA